MRAKLPRTKRPERPEAVDREHGRAGRKTMTIALILTRQCFV